MCGISPVTGSSITGAATGSGTGGSKAKAPKGATAGASSTSTANALAGSTAVSKKAGTTNAAAAGATAGAQNVTQGGGATQTGATGAPGHTGHGHEKSMLYGISNSPPNGGMFIQGSTGATAGTNFKLDKGAGFQGKKGRNPNANDQKQNNLTKADANRSAYGIPNQVAGTGQRPNYVMDIQVGIGMGGLEALRPDVLQTLIDNQNAGRGSVWNGVAYLTGLNDQHDGSVPPQLEAMRGEIMNTAVGNSGKTLAQWAVNPKDSRGNNWARTNHAQTGIKAYLQLEGAGIPSAQANQIANNDDLVSGAGRIDQLAPGRASNNQENTFTGMNAAERKQWAKAAQLGGPVALQIMMGSHTMGAHMNTQFGNKGAKSKINGNLGIDPNMPAEQRQQLLVDYFMTNQKDPKKGTAAKTGGGAQAAAGATGAGGAKAGATAQGGGGGGAAGATQGAGALGGASAPAGALAGASAPAAPVSAAAAPVSTSAPAPIANALSGADLLGQLQALLAQLTAILAALTGASTVAQASPTTPVSPKAAPAAGGVAGAASGNPAQVAPAGGGRLPAPTAMAGATGGGGSC